MSPEPVEILLVEDNPDHAELVRVGLEEQQIDCRLTHVADGQAALDYLRGRGDFADSDPDHRPHLIILDLRLPKIDGLEVLREIKDDRDLRHTPVVILTTSAADQDVVKAYDYHANSYLVKPLEYDQFSRMMTDMSEYWLEWNTKPI